MTKHRFKEEPRIDCPSCGQSNRLGSFICSRCGARIYSQMQRAPTIPQRITGGPRAAFRNAVLAGLAVCVCVVMLLAAWPYVPVGEMGTRTEDFVSALSQLEAQVQQGVPVTPLVLREAAINRWIADRNPPLKQMRVDLSSGRLVLIGNESIGPFTLGTRIVAVTDKESGRVQVQSAWIGHLPLPRSSARRLFSGLARRFQFGFLPEALWTDVAILRLDAGAMQVGPPPEER